MNSMCASSGYDVSDWALRVRLPLKDERQRGGDIASASAVIAMRIKGARTKQIEPRAVKK
jgi:hypothetical protein